MCKYCEFTYVDDEEKTTFSSIARIEEGYRITEVLLHRYQTDDENRNELILDEAVKLNGNLHTVERKTIKIKYCPFCGEKL